MLKFTRNQDKIRLLLFPDHRIYDAKITIERFSNNASSTGAEFSIDILMKKIKLVVGREKLLNLRIT